MRSRFFIKALLAGGVGGAFVTSPARAQDSRTAAAPSAAAVQVRKVGANGIHGGLFAFNRNAVGAARTHSVRNLAKPKYNRNEYGGSVGGPIRTNNLFYLRSYQGLRLVKSSGSPLTITKAS